MTPKQHEMFGYAVAAVRDEYAEAKGKFKDFNSDHEGFAVILEELDELWEAIKKNKSNGRKRDEAVQVAAMAIRFLTDVIYTPEYGGEDG